MDSHIPKAITQQLRFRAIDIITSQEDGREDIDDDILLQRATDLNRVMVTFDTDLLQITQKWLMENKTFAGLFFARPINTTIGTIVMNLEIIAKAGNSSDVINQIIFL